MTRIDKDQLGLVIAAAWAQRGTCARRRVGCALFDADGYCLSTGYNGPAAGETHCVDIPCPGAGLSSGTGLDDCEALHAEWNALSRCADVRAIRTCYVSSSPCVTCVKMLMNTGCRRIVFAQRYAHDERAQYLWKRSRPPWQIGDTASTMFRTWELVEPSLVIAGIDRIASKIEREA